MCVFMFVWIGCKMNDVNMIIIGEDEGREIVDFFKGINMFLEFNLLIYIGVFFYGLIFWFCYLL